MNAVKHTQVICCVWVAHFNQSLLQGEKERGGGMDRELEETLTENNYFGAKNKAP